MSSYYFFLALYSICMIVLVILWLQSGVDKVTDFKGNYDWLKGHFAKSPLKGVVKLMLIKLTFLELSSGLAAFAAIIEVWFFGSWQLSFAACFISLLSLTALFFGQRMSKEYGGAASLMGYFIYVLLVLAFSVVMKEYSFGVHHPNPYEPAL